MSSSNSFGQSSAQPGGNGSNVYSPKYSEDWEPYKEIVTDLYNTMTMKEVRERLEKDYNFKVT